MLYNWRHGVFVRKCAQIASGTFSSYFLAGSGSLAAQLGLVVVVVVVVMMVVSTCCCCCTRLLDSHCLPIYISFIDFRSESILELVN